MVELQQKYIEQQRKGLNWKRIAASFSLVVLTGYLANIYAVAAVMYLLTGNALYRKMYSGFQPVSYMVTTVFWLPLIFVDLATGDEQ